MKRQGAELVTYLSSTVAHFLTNGTGTIIVAAVAIFSATAVAEPPPAAPISRSDVREITRVIARVTKKPILMIVGVIEESPVPGAVKGGAYMLNTNTGERTPQYIRTDLVSVYMRYTDRSHVDVYAVRKVRGRWKIESKKDWFL